MSRAGGTLKLAVALALSMALAACGSSAPSVASHSPAASSAASATASPTHARTSAPASVLVPAVNGLSQSAAVTALGKAHLTLVVQTRASSATVPLDHVISQSPAAGIRVHRGTRVVVTLSAGNVVRVVPNVVGLSYRQAQTRLAQLGLHPTIVLAATPAGVKAGTVLRTTPAAGTKAPLGSTVTITYAGAVEAVPLTAGLTITEATQALMAAGFVVRVEHTPYAPGDSVKQTIPAGGKEVQQGSTVVIVPAPKS